MSKQAPTSKSRYDPSRVGLVTSFSAKLFLWLSGERTGLSSKSSILQDLATTAKKYQLGPPVTTRKQLQFYSLQTQNSNWRSHYEYLLRVLFKKILLPCHVRQPIRGQRLQRLLRGHRVITGKPPLDTGITLS